MANIDRLTICIQSIKLVNERFNKEIKVSTLPKFREICQIKPVNED